MQSGHTLLKGTPWVTDLVNDPGSVRISVCKAVEWYLRFNGIRILVFFKQAPARPPEAPPGSACTHALTHRRLRRFGCLALAS